METEVLLNVIFVILEVAIEVDWMYMSKDHIWKMYDMNVISVNITLLEKIV